MIEDGKITYPVKGATLIGNGPDVLTRVSMIGNDMQLDSGVGTCGKEGQSVPVGVGQPTLKIDGLTVGGTASQLILGKQKGANSPFFTPIRKLLKYTISIFASTCINLNLITLCTE